MLIKLGELIRKYNIKIRGVLHIGAHECEEHQDYINSGANINNIIWIEGNPTIYKKIKRRFPKRIILNGLISDKDNEEKIFYIANNGQSSSILEFGTHAKHHPHVKYQNSYKLKTKTIKTLLKENNVNMKPLNFLNIDIQGAELLALKGMNDLLNNFDYLYLEVNTEKVYKDCPLIEDIDEYVKQYGFKRTETRMTRFGWGDAYYTRI